MLIDQFLVQNYSWIAEACSYGQSCAFRVSRNLRVLQGFNRCFLKLCNSAKSYRDRLTEKIISFEALVKRVNPIQHDSSYVVAK
jgi:hypothetical protein